MIISPYTPDVVRPQYEAFKYNTDLIGKVLLYKQAAFDDAYKNIQNLRQQALNINFLNEKEQGKIDHFNNQVNDFFSKTQEFGDLSDSNISSRYTRVFNIIGKDPEIINRYKQDKKYQQMLVDVENKKNAKDPRKEGFHPINYGNFLSRIQEYSKTDLDTESFEVRPYNNYVDYKKEIAAQVKNVPIKKFTQEMPTGDGRIVSITRVGRDPNEVRRVVSDYMQSNGITQLREEAEFELRNNQSIPGKAGLYNNYNGYITQQADILSQQLETVRARQKTAKGAEIVALAQQQALIETKLSDLDLSQHSPQNFFDRDQDEIIGDLTNVRLYNGVDNLTNAYGGYAESRTYKADTAWLQLARLNQNAAVAQAKMQTDLAKAGISAQGANGTLTGDGGVLQPDAVSLSQPTTEDFGSVLSSVEASLTKLTSQEANLFSTGLQSNGQQIRSENEIANDLLRNPNSLDKNPMYAGSPWIKAFKLARLEAMREYDVIDQTTAPLMLEKVLPEVERIVNNPQTAEEVKINRELQDIRANKQSVESFLKEANDSGDPVKYIENRPNIYTYASGMKILDKKGLTGDRAKRVEAANLAMFNVVQNHIGNINPIGKEGEQVVTLDRQWMKHAQVFDNGLVRVWLDPELFKDAEDDDKDGELLNNYFVIGDEEVRPTASKPYIEFEDPQFQKVNWSKHIGLRLTERPQKRWGWSLDQQSLPFEIRMVDGNIQYSINGGKFHQTNTGNPEVVLEHIYQVIGNSNSTDFNQQ